MSGVEEDILVYEISSSPEVDNGDETTEVCDLDNIATSPIMTFPSTEFRTGVAVTNETENSNNRDQCALPISRTAANPSEPVNSLKVTINLEKFVVAESTENSSFLNSATQADESSSSEFDGECCTNAPRSPILKVSFGGSSSFLSRDQSNAKEDSDSDASRICSPTLSKHTYRISYKASSSVSNARLQRNTAESDTAQERRTPMTTASKCPPTVSFNPSSLIFSDHQTGCECLENPTPGAPAEMSTNISFNRSSLLGSPSVSSSDDELQLLPTDNTSKDLDSVQRAVSSNSSNSGFQAVGNSDLMKRSGGLRGILKLKKDLSLNEKIVTDCLKLLCKTASDDPHLVRDKIYTSANAVFKNLCFDQFFQKGECFSSTCDDNHHYKSHIFTHPNEELWNASLYVICHATTPNLQVVENLVQHYAEKGNTIRTLLLGKCIAKVKDVDRLELAHFVVSKLSGTIPTRDVITVILMLNFSELSPLRYNILMEGIGVFEQNTTHYTELMAFLNFHGHKMPARLLVKLMEDSIKYSCKGSIVESISGFLKRLHPSQKDEVQPTASDFEKCFGIPTAANKVNQMDDTLGQGPPEKISKVEKKKVIFAADPDVREFEVADCPREKHCEVEHSQVDFSDEDCEDNCQPDIPTFYGSSEPRGETIKRVFGESCCTWILNGQCLNANCDLTHCFQKDSLAGLSSKDVLLAADFIIDESKTPSFEILKIFIEFLAKSNEIPTVLKFRRCTLKLSTRNSLKLTRIVISLLAEQIGLWEAIEKVLVPNVANSDDPDDGRFLFDKELLHFIIMKANETRTSVLRCVTRAITDQMAMLPQPKSFELVRATSLFMEKFVLTGREQPPFPDILPMKTIEPNTFARDLKVALYRGVSSKYFIATIMMRQAVSSSFRNQAVDVLYTFLLSNFDRARVLTHLFENCKYFDASTQRSVKDLFGAVALKTAIRLYESENFSGTAEIFNVLGTFKLSIFALLATHEENMTELTLATIYCSVKIDTVDSTINGTIDTFLSRCVDPLMSAGFECPPDLMKLIAKMFRVFTSAQLVEESLKLYKGITVRQKSLVSPLNIVEFVEPTLRCTFSRPSAYEIRKESLMLYLDVVASETPITFQKVTHRSMFLFALMDVTHAALKYEVKGHRNTAHPLIKKMLLTCIKAGVYFDIRTPDITIYSSMTAAEIEIYFLWWFFLYVRSRKKNGCDCFNPVTVRIVQDCIQDDTRLPLHPSLRSVSVSITDCAERVTSVVSNAITKPIDIINSRERGVFELHPATVEAMSQTVCSIMLQHGYIAAEKDRVCTFCFDKLDIKLAEKL